MRDISIALFCLALTASPTAVSAQQVGQLIAADPVVDTPGGMQAWRIRYWTSDGSGRPREVTGMVVAPREAIPATPRNVLAWTHGAWGVASKCAPSLSLDKFWTVSPGLLGVRRGYVVVAPDYPGLGSAGVHPFLVGEDTGRSTLDAVRAARSIPGAAAASGLPFGANRRVVMRHCGRRRSRRDMRPISPWSGLRRRHRRPT